MKIRNNSLKINNLCQKRELVTNWSRIGHELVTNWSRIGHEFIKTYNAESGCAKVRPILIFFITYLLSTTYSLF